MADDVAGPIYAPFFAGLLDLVCGRPIDTSLGESICRYVGDFLKQGNPLRVFDRYSSESYVRTYLGRSETAGWEALSMSWRQGNRTRIHAHPQFAGYCFAEGTFRLEVFEADSSGGAHCVSERIVEAPESFFAIGAPGRFDNHIHRITCLSATGHSLHVYSDDALRGLLYEAAGA